MLEHKNIQKEFKSMLTNRQAAMQPYPIEYLYPYELDEGVLHKGYAKGITERFFSALNGTTFEIVYRQRVYKPQYLSDGSIRKDKEGNQVKDHIPVPRECVLIKSEVNIRLRLQLENGSKYEEKEEYNYIKRVKKTIGGKQKNFYYYIIPRRFVFSLNLNALILTRKPRKMFYSAFRVALQDGTFAYLSVVPYKKKLEGVALLSTYPTTDFSQFVQSVYAYWVSQGLTFDTNLGYIEDEDKNLTYSYLEPTLNVEDYTALDGLIAQYEEEEE